MKAWRFNRWVLFLLAAGCTAGNSRYLEIEVPAHLADSLPYPARNTPTALRVQLGRKLFYDPFLSANGKVSCSTCHQQRAAFSDGMARSTLGVTHKELHRHTPSLINLAWDSAYFWDGGVKDLESQTFAPLTRPDEMGNDLKELMVRLRSHPEYPKLFQQAYGIDSIVSAYVARALAQFQRTLISANSRYDQYKLGNAPLEDDELTGLVLFRESCSSCHPEPFFTDHGFHNNGLDSVFSDDQAGIHLGRFRITRDSLDLGKFKTPTLRNVELSAPYMHDGRFKDLDAVLHHYSEGLLGSEMLDPNMESSGFQFSSDEKRMIISFLRTLTDSGFVQNPELSQPL